MAYTDRKRHEHADDRVGAEGRGRGMQRWWPWLAVVLAVLIMLMFLARPDRDGAAPEARQPSTSAPAAPDTSPDRTP